MLVSFRSVFNNSFVTLKKLADRCINVYGQVANELDESSVRYQLHYIYYTLPCFTANEDVQSLYLLSECFCFLPVNRGSAHTAQYCCNA